MCDRHPLHRSPESGIGQGDRFQFGANVVGSVPDGWWRHLVGVGRTVIDPIERLRERVPFATRLAAWVGNGAHAYVLEKELAGRDADFAPPRALRQASI